MHTRTLTHAFTYGCVHAHACTHVRVPNHTNTYVKNLKILLKLQNQSFGPRSSAARSGMHQLIAQHKEEFKDTRKSAMIAQQKLLDENKQ